MDTQKNILMKDRTIADTGERMVPAYHLGHLLYGEHIIRYQAAESFVKGKVVLDIASGSGYGTFLLANSARHIYGVDLNPEAVAYAQKNYKKENIDFKAGSATSIPLESQSCDIVISFETLEHVAEYRAFLAEIKRVLKPDGLLILSTPNDDTFPKTNQFHVHEFEYTELCTEIKNYFSELKEYFQGTWLYSILLDKERLESTWTEQVITTAAAPIKEKQSAYFFMLCSNREITESLDRPLGSFSENWSARTTYEETKSFYIALEERQNLLQAQQVALEDARSLLVKNEQEITKLQERNAELEKRYHHTESLYRRFIERK